MRIVVSVILFQDSEDIDFRWSGLILCRDQINLLSEILVYFDLFPWRVLPRSIFEIAQYH